MNIQQPLRTTPAYSGRDVTAVLGPTNTGKTHLAIERMVAHSSGIIGLPLRLLAREVHARVCEKVGPQNVALITGEEKIVPPGARFSVCTVEAMPRETDAAFVAIDEIQLADDLERGHVFTDRILNLRGRQETLLLGSQTMRGILERLLRGVSVVTRPRMSTLSYAGSKKITRLPARSAIVAFSADEVYAIGELIRRQRGGAAVVLGALSPRTRNAQVELYQSGDVDFLVATDAIGMGLNLDVDHVAFAQNRKFDGFQYRELSAAELGQIAGRAGRHIRDGTFGVTGQVDPFEDDLVEKIESHDFQPVKVLQWRTSSFDFSSIDALRNSLDTTPSVEGLTRALPAVDQRALEHVARDADIRALAMAKGGVEKLWDACALPDYRRIAPAEHAELIASVFADLMKRGHVDENYMAEQVRRATSVEGDIDALSRRIAHIRTWTFVSHRPGWLADPTHWQEKTREIEDRLSDALHERLTKRFVDRRTSVLMRRLRENAMTDAEISPSGDVMVEGHHVGALTGFRFTPDQSAVGEDARAVKTAAQKALAQEFETRAERFSACGNGDLALASDGTLRWIGAPVATLAAGDDALKPRVILLTDDQLAGPARDKVAARAERFVAFQIETLLKQLVDLKSADQLTGIARGLAFQLVENFGVLNRRDVANDMKSLDQEARAALRRLGVRFGAYHIFLPALIKPAPASLSTLLYALKHDRKDRPGFGDVVSALSSGRTSAVVDPDLDRDFYRLAGFRVLGKRAVRVDILERLADLIRPALSWKPGTGKRPDGGFDGAAFLVTPAMMSILGAKAEDMEEILKNLGYRAEPKKASDVEIRLAEFDAAEAARIEAGKAAASAKAAAEEAAASFEAMALPAESEGGDGQVEISASQIDDAGLPAENPSEIEPPADAGSPNEAAIGAIEPVPDILQPEPTAAQSEATGDVAPPSTENAPEPAALAETKIAPASLSPGEAGATIGDALRPADEVPEPKPILVWRPARLDDRGRPDHRGRGNRGPNRAAATAATSGEAGTGDASAGRSNRHNRRRPAAAEDGKSKEPRVLWSADMKRPERPAKPRFERNADGGGGRKDEHRGEDRGNKREDRRPDRKQEPQKPREERPVRFDPDSPFAKLAALRDQLKK